MVYMIVLGLTGQTASGKGEVVKELVNSYGYKHYSIRSLLSPVLKENNERINIENLGKVANLLRRDYGSDFLVKTLYNKIPASQHKVIIESIRHPQEIVFLKKETPWFFLIAVVSPLPIRWERTKADKNLSCDLGYTKFLQLEERASNPENLYEQNVGECISKSDFVINNIFNKDELSKLLRGVMNAVEARVGVSGAFNLPERFYKFS